MESTASEKHLHEHSDEEPAEERQITGSTEQEHNTQADTNWRGLRLQHQSHGPAKTTPGDRQRWR